MPRKRLHSGSPDPLDTPLRDLFDCAEGFLAVLSPSGNLLKINRAIAGISGGVVAEAIGQPIWDTFWYRRLPEQQASLRRIVAESAAGATVSTELVYRGADGSTRHAEASFHPVRDPVDGEIRFLLAEGRDVTERKKVEAALLRSELELRTMIDSVGSFVASVDSDGRVVRVNREAVRTSGTSEPDTLGRFLWELPAFASVEGEAKRVRTEILEAIAGRASRREVRFRDADGALVHADASVTPVFDADGDVFRVVVDSRDVTRRVLTERRLRRSESRYRALFQQSGEGVILCDAAGTIVDLNAAAETMFGCARAEIAGQDVASFFDGAPSVRDAVEGERDVSFEMVRRDPTGAERVFSVNLGFVRSEETRLLLLQAIVHDLTEQRRLEKALHRSQRLESMGRVAAGVAHEINNPLTWILANVEDAAAAFERLAADSTAPIDAAGFAHALREAGTGARRIARIVSEIRLLGKSDDEPAVETDVGATARQAVELAGAEVRDRARVVVDSPDGLRVLLPEGRLLQVILNILLNAAKAIGEGDPDRHEIRISSGTADGMIRIDVSDTGCGIARENLESLFEPFFTTRAGSGGGTGLGLWICDRIVRAAAGRIDVESTPGSGSRFTVWLPLPGEAPAAPSAIEAPADRLPDEAAAPVSRVLVVDDEPLLLRLIERVLRRKHDVSVARSVDEALSAVEQGERFDLVLCDLTLPDRDGMALWNELSARHPDLAARTVFMTGGASSPEGKRFLEELDAPWLEKPFQRSDVLVFVDEALRRIGREGADLSLRTDAKSGLES